MRLSTQQVTYWPKILHLSNIWDKLGIQQISALSSLYTSRKLTIQVVGVFFNILIEFDFTMKLVRLLKICLNETYRMFHVGNHLCQMFPIMNGLKMGCYNTTSSRICFRVHDSESSRVPERFEIKRYVSASVLRWVFNTLRRSERTVKKKTKLSFLFVKMLIKLNSCSCLEFRMQDEVTVWRWIIIFESVE